MAGFVAFCRVQWRVLAAPMRTPLLAWMVWAAAVVGSGSARDRLARDQDTLSLQQFEDELSLLKCEWHVACGYGTFTAVDRCTRARRLSVFADWVPSKGVHFDGRAARQCTNWLKSNINLCWPWSFWSIQQFGPPCASVLTGTLGASRSIPTRS